MAVTFTDYSARIKGILDEQSSIFLREAAIEVEAEAQTNTPTTKPQLKGSWSNAVDVEKKEATVGSPMEAALWNEYGTGSHAEAKHGGTGQGRQGWWVYVEGQPRREKSSTVYQSQQEAEAVASSMRAQGFDAHASNGEEAHFTLFNAFDSKKSKIQRMAEELIREGLEG